MDRAAAKQVTETVRKRYGQLIAKAWADPKFLGELQADPKKTLSAQGWPIAEELHVKILANTPELIHFVLPPKPAVNLTGEQLVDDPGAPGSVGSAGTVGTVGCPLGTAGSVGTSGCWGGS